MMDQLFHGADPPQSEAAAADALGELWNKYSSFPTDHNLNPHLRYSSCITTGNAMLQHAQQPLWNVACIVGGHAVIICLIPTFC